MGSLNLLYSVVRATRARLWTHSWRESGPVIVAVVLKLERVCLVLVAGGAC